jgi:hypothetical protein
MNELLFFLHIAVAILFALIALRLGEKTLIAWIALQAVLANLFVIKQMAFFGFQITCSDVFAIGSVLGLNLLQEYFGKESAKKALFATFFAMLFFVTMGQIHLAYTPSPFDTTQVAFQTILSPTPRILFASIGVFFLVQQLDIRLFGFLKARLPQLSLTLRNGLSTTLTQFLDTLFFSLIGLWGLVALLGDVILISFLVKVCILLCLTPITALSKRIIPLEKT